MVDETLADAGLLARFHAGDRVILERCYRAHVAKVLAAASRVLHTVDAETVAHDVFLRLLSDPAMRRGFSGGNLGAWLARIASNAAIDMQRRRKLETPTVEGVDPRIDGGSGSDDELAAKLLFERFCRDRLPEKWGRLFDARFLRQLSQRDAAAELGIERSTLAYQEQQVRALLTTFLLEVGES